jgi:cold shock CspA family protein
MQTQGTIRFYSGDKGFGFIRPDNETEEDIFFHIRQFGDGSGVGMIPRVGARVAYTPNINPRSGKREAYAVANDQERQRSSLVNPQSWLRATREPIPPVGRSIKRLMIGGASSLQFARHLRAGHSCSGESSALFDSAVLTGQVFKSHFSTP